MTGRGMEHGFSNQLGSTTMPVEDELVAVSSALKFVAYRFVNLQQAMPSRCRRGAIVNRLDMNFVDGALAAGWRRD
jgi:hypothetical protein